MQVTLERSDLLLMLEIISGNCFIQDIQEITITELEKLEKKNLVEIYEIEPNTNGYQLNYSWLFNEPEFMRLSDEDLYKYYKKYKDLK